MASEAPNTSLRTRAAIKRMADDVEVDLPREKLIATNIRFLTLLHEEKLLSIRSGVDDDKIQ